MQKTFVTPGGSKTSRTFPSGKPTLPLTVGRQPIIERKISDPSSALPRGERYPIPSFFEYRIKQRDEEADS